MIQKYEFPIMHCYVRFLQIRSHFNLTLKLSYLIMYINYINQASIWFLEIAIVHEVQLAKPGMHRA